MNSWCRNLQLLLKSRTTLIWIRTKEEERLEKLVNLACEGLSIKRVISWDCVNGIKGLINEDKIVRIGILKIKAVRMILIFQRRLVKLFMRGLKIFLSRFKLNWWQISLLLNHEKLSFSSINCEK